jgi:molecular chaperone GrpE (heat shock protein)
MEISQNDFVFHNELGVGKILNIIQEQPLEVTIQFFEQPPRVMTGTLLKRSVEKISPFAFRALAYAQPEMAKQLLEEKPVDVICLVLEDFPGNAAKTEKLREYLVPYAQDWDSWWKITQPLLKEDPRIDTTHSRLQQYALAQEVRSRTEEVYRSFRYAREHITESGILAMQARSALSHFRQTGEDLTEQEQLQVDEILNYLKQVINLEKYPLALRFETLFRLLDDRWLAKDYAVERFEQLYKNDFKLYHLEPVIALRVIDMLVSRPLGSRELEIISTGMCSGEKVITRVSSWSVAKGDPEIISLCIITALSENLPPMLEKERRPTLRQRLSACQILLECLTNDQFRLQETLQAFKKTCKAVAIETSHEDLPFIAHSLTGFAASLNNRVQTIDPENKGVLESLAEPNYSMSFILEIIDRSQEKETTKLFAQQLENYLFENAEARGGDYIGKWVDEERPVVERAARLLELVRQYPSRSLIEMAGNKLCEIASQAGNELLELLPYLDQFHYLNGKWIWQGRVRGLREEGYFIMFSGKGKTYTDLALLSAVQRAEKLLLKPLKEKQAELQNHLDESQEKIVQLQSLLNEKETILREVHENPGGDTREARFEERTYILRDLVNSLAEFERFAASRPAQSKEILAVLRRFDNMLVGFKVTATEPIGQQVPFNPQKHRLTGSGDAVPGDIVLIIEKGYLIRDHRDKLRLLKSAMVTKADS